MSVRVTFQGADYQNGDQVRARVDQLVERLRALPGVTAIGIGSILPLGGLGALNDFAVDGAPPPPPNVNQEIAVASASPDYFKAIGAPLKRGRLFNDLDQPKSPAVALLNEAAARKWFPGEDPIGRHVMSGGPREIVGIVGDVLQRTPGQPAAAQLFLPYTQRSGRTVRIIVRAEGDPLALAPSVREQIRALDPNLPLAEATPLQDVVTRSVARPRFYMSLLTLFAAVALALSATGIFGVMSYAVAQQSKEIGIRMALGAQPRDVLRMVVGEGLLLVLLGVVIGVGAGVALSHYLTSLFFGVSPANPVTYLEVALLMIAIALIACLLPALRAVRVNPMTALRYE
jgi:putative ABC transport system permease protein